MRLIKHQLRNNEGEITIVPESLDDLWHLKYVLEKGDLVFAVTFRKVETATDKLRPEKAEKRPIRLGIRLERVEFHKFANRLRLHGVIEQGIDVGNHHTFNIEQNSELSIIKSWKRDQIERINEAVRASNQPRVAIATIEDGEAIFGVVKQYGVEETANIKGSRGKKEGGDPRGEFFEEVLQKLELLAANVETIVIAGPGFTKDDFIAYVKQKKPDLEKKFLVEDTSSIGTSGFQEVFKRGAIDRILQKSRITQEALLIEKLLGEIARDKGKVAYGLAEVRRAMEYGAIDTLLIVDETLRAEREKEAGLQVQEIEAMLKSVEKARGNIVIFSSEFEPGKRLQALGGVAALLRFRI